jgi:hypothetical protein
MKYFLAFILVLTTFGAPAQSSAGIGLGFDWIEGFEADPVYDEKDVNLFFSTVRKKKLALEFRQGFRYMHSFRAMRFNTYLLGGYTTRKDMAFVFDLLIGGAISWASPENERVYPSYPAQFCPTAKTGFYFRINRQKKIYLGMDWLFSTYHYYHSDRFGRPSRTGGWTGSVLLSLGFVIPDKSDREKPKK